MFFKQNLNIFLQAFVTPLFFLHVRISLHRQDVFLSAFCHNTLQFISLQYIQLTELMTASHTVKISCLCWSSRM